MSRVYVLRCDRCGYTPIEKRDDIGHISLKIDRKTDAAGDVADVYFDGDYCALCLATLINDSGETVGTLDEIEWNSLLLKKLGLK